MGRHNTVAGRMAESAAFRGKLFTKLARLITVAARHGSDPNSNSALRSAIAKAKDNSMPKENIDRAIKKGSGEGHDTTVFEEILYEARGPGGVGILVETLTDNRNRTYPELRVILQKSGGMLSEVGSISWMFQRKGVFVIDTQEYGENKILEAALSCSIEDSKQVENDTILTCDPISFAENRQILLSHGIEFERAGIEFIPDNQIELNAVDTEKLKILLEKIHDHDDVQNVYANAKLNE